MATTLGLTPLPADAAVRVQVTTTGSSSPTVVLSKTAAQIEAEASTAPGVGSWSGTWTSCDLYGDVCAFYSVSSAGSAYRPITGLTVGKRYRADLRVELADTTSTALLKFGVNGGAGITPFVTIPKGTGRATVSVEWVATATTGRVTLDTVSNNLPMIESLTVTQLPDGFVFSLTRGRSDQRKESVQAMSLSSTAFAVTG